MNLLKELIIEDLDRLTTHELGKVYKFIRRELIAEIPDRTPCFSEETEFAIKEAQESGKKLMKHITHRQICNTCKTVTDHIAGTCQICRRSN